MSFQKKQLRSKLRPNKYGVAPKAARTVDGTIFASKLESERFALLKIMEGAGRIKNLRLQPKYILQEEFEYQGEKIKAIFYQSDFEYENLAGALVVEDTKSVATRTKDYLLKRKMFLFKYGSKVEFHEINNAMAIGGVHDPRTGGGKTSVGGRHDGPVQEKRSAGGVAND